MGGGGTGEVTSPPVGTGVTSGGLFSGVVGGGVTETEKKKRRAPSDPLKKKNNNQEDNSRGVGGSGSSDITSPPEGTRITSGGLFSGVVSGGVTDIERDHNETPKDTEKWH